VVYQYFLVHTMVSKEKPNASLQDALMGVVASLAAAISLLERGGKAIKKTVASDKMFDQMMVDYRASIDKAVLAYKQEAPK